MSNCNPEPSFCPVDRTMAVIGGKWKPTILYYLQWGTRRNGELLRLMPALTQKVLTRQLRELEKDGIIERTVYPVVPPHVEYSLTEYGKTLQPVLEAMAAWGFRHREQIEQT